MTHDPREGKPTPAGAGGHHAADPEAPAAPAPSRYDAPLAHYLAELATDATARTLARRGTNAKWETPLWWFVRQAKPHEGIVRLAAGDAFAAVSAVLACWADPRTNAPAPDPWRRWLGVSREDAEVEFLTAWDKVRYLPGSTPLGNAAFEAGLLPLRLDPQTSARRSNEYPRFVSLAGHLQVVTGAKPIYLPSREVAKMLSLGDAFSVSHTTVTSYVKWALEDDYLRLVSPHTRERAARHVFAVGKFPVLSDRADPAVLEMWAATPKAATPKAGEG